MGKKPFTEPLSAMISDADTVALRCPVDADEPALQLADAAPIRTPAITTIGPVLPEAPHLGVVTRSICSQPLASPREAGWQNGA